MSSCMVARAAGPRSRCGSTAVRAPPPLLLLLPLAPAPPSAGTRPMPGCMPPVCPALCRSATAGLAPRGGGLQCTAALRHLRWGTSSSLPISRRRIQNPLPIFFDMVHSNNAARVRLWLRLKAISDTCETPCVETRMVTYPDLQTPEFAEVPPRCPHGCPCCCCGHYATNCAVVSPCRPQIRPSGRRR